MKIQVIIVDDEPRAHKVLENYIHRLNGIQIAGMFTNGSDAIEYIKSHHVDIILLDITMPVIDGFTFLSMLPFTPLVIFTTAHSEFALKSYDVDAVDYLKKPIPFERFEKAVNKAIAKLEIRDNQKPAPDFIILKVNGSSMSILLKDINYFQSFGNYVKIFTATHILLSQMTTKELEAILPTQIFVRVHKSYIVNKQKIKMLTEEDVLLNDIKLPIGKTFKKYLKNNILL